MTETDPKDRIRQAAHELMMKYSLRTVSMDDIAASVGMSKKTLYQYFQDKDELVTAVVEGILTENRCTCDSQLAASENAVHEIFLAKQMMVEMFQNMNPNIVYEMQKYHRKAFQCFHAHKTQYLLKHIEQNIVRGIAEELYRPEINAQILARYRVETMFVPFEPDFQRSLPKATLLHLHDEILMNFLFGLLTAKGFKVAMKYMAERDKKLQNNK